MWRSLLAVAVVLSLAACGPDDSLPPSVPPIVLPVVDGGPDAGPVDGGAGFLAQCADAGCGAGTCEPLADAGVACGVKCGKSCGTLCDESRCDDPNSGWGRVFCGPLPDGGLAWTSSPDCDDGNDCTDSDVCTNGTCKGMSSPTSTGCDDNNVCTTGDHCDGNGGCTGTPANDDQDRFYDSGAVTYAYAAPGGWSFSGWDSGTKIYASAPGGQPIYLLFDNSAVDRILSFSTSQSSYASNATPDQVGTGYSTQKPGTIELKVASYTCGAVSGSCGTIGGSSAARHYFYTAGNGSPPAGSGAGSGIFVCPP
ncbi:MAG: hypothetical protein JST54_23045 [Deltaproteobacteria bacterium]|nr:hypothetical protein [Deltaproteobacteria bacterium]